MRRSVALPVGIAVSIVVLVLLVSQFVLPPLVARTIEKRLTKGGGSAHASVRAFPALRLLFRHGSSIDVTGTGLNVQLSTAQRHALKNLDGFGSVHIHLADVSAGPFHTQSFALDRNKDESTYTLGVRASFTPSALASYLGSNVGGGLGGLFGGLAGGLLGGSQPVPVAVRAVLRSDGGDPEVVSGAGSVAGVPMGPLLEAVTAAIIARF
jgi:hypothetical protein